MVSVMTRGPTTLLLVYVLLAGISNGQQQQLRAMPNTGTIFGRGVSLPPRSAVQWLLDVDLLPLPIQPVR